MLTTNREQLREIADSKDGTLDGTPFPLILLAAAIHQRTALLSLRREPLEKNIVFEQGTPVDCMTNVATETIGRFMVSAGKLTEPDLQQALVASASRGVPIEDILIDRDLVTASDLYRLLQQNLARKLLDCFTWSSGTFQISEEVPLVESPLRVRVPQLVLTGIMKVATESAVDRALLAFAGLPLMLHPEPLVSREELRLTAGQKTILEGMRSPVSIEELRQNTEMPADDLNRFLHALLLLGCVGVASELPARNPFLRFELDLPAAPAPPKPAEQVAAKTEVIPLAPAPPRERSDVARIDPARRDDLMRLYLSYRRKDPFELLDVPEDATIGTIVRAYLKFADRFAPSLFDGDPGESLREKAEEIFLAAARAYADLADSESRIAIVEKKRSLRAAPQPAAQTDRAASRSGMVDPEDFFQKGKALFEAGKAKEALPQLQAAADYDAQNGNYAAELAWCRFHLFKSTGPQALTALKQALRTDPQCGLACYYAGKVHVSIGNRLEAEAYLRKAAELMRGDNRPREALRSLLAPGSP